jgi:phage baseplate assembly protein gpV
MMHDEHGNRTDLIGSYEGIVYSNRDPQNLGRIRVTIPSIADQPATGWLDSCLPAAGKNRGLWAIPAIGDTVVVEFYQGDPDRGYYTGGVWTTSNTPPEESQNDPEIWVLARDKYVIIIDDKNSKFTILNRDSNDSLTIDSSDLSISINATASISLTSLGSINLSAPSVTVNNVPLIPGVNNF